MKFIGNLGSHVALKHTKEFLEFMESMRLVNPTERAKPAKEVKVPIGKRTLRW